MPKFLRIAAIASALAGAALTTACIVDDGPHRYRNQADVGVSVDFGHVAYGYRDGYWDNQRQWHRWRHQDEARRYRQAPNKTYHDWDHTRDSNQGWYDRDDSRR